MQWAAAFAGVAIDNCGTAIAHALGHAMGSLRPIHHGRAVGIAMLASLPWNVEDNDAFAACAADIGAEPSARGLHRRLREAFARERRQALARRRIRRRHAEQLAAQTARPENAAMRNSNKRGLERRRSHLARRVLTLL